MSGQLVFIGKVIGWSAVLALVIKYLAPYLDVPATATNAIVAILLPTLVLAIALAWRWRSGQVPE